jgi:hypothetical protein
VGWTTKEGPPLLPCPDGLCNTSELLCNGYEGLSAGVKRLVREADHSPPTSAEVKKALVYTRISTAESTLFET